MIIKKKEGRCLSVCVCVCVGIVFGAYRTRMESHESFQMLVSLSTIWSVIYVCPVCINFSSLLRYVLGANIITTALRVFPFTNSPACVVCWFFTLGVCVLCLAKVTVWLRKMHAKLYKNTNVPAKQLLLHPSIHTFCFHFIPPHQLYPR